MLESEQILWDLNAVVIQKISLVPAIYIPIHNVNELHSTVVALVMIKRRGKTMHTVQTAQAVQLYLFAFFKL